MADHGEFFTSSGSPKKTPVRRPSSQLDFEIEFYEKVLRRAPSYVETLRVLGEELTQKGLYQRGLEVDQQLVRLRPHDPVARYNLACSYALLNCNRPALEALRKAIELGFRNRRLLQGDPDLNSVRDDPAYQQLLREQGWG